MKWMGALVLLVGSIALAQPISENIVDLDKLYLDSERIYLKGDSAGALKSLDNFFSRQKTAPKNYRAEARGHNLKGLIFFQTRNLQGAVQEFESAAKIANENLPPNDIVLHLARYNLGNALFQLGKAQESLEIMRTVVPDTLDSDTRMRFYHLFGNLDASLEATSDAMIQYLQASNLAKDSIQRDSYLQKAFNISKKGLKNTAEDVTKLSQLNFPPESSAALATKFFMAKAFMFAGTPLEAEKLVREFLDKSEANHPLRPKAMELLSDIANIANVEPDSIGVLLPLSGKFSKFGHLCLNSINMALGIFEDMPERTNGLKLVVRDSGETADSAIEAFDDLVKKDKVIAVIGPLLSKQFPGVASRAQELGTVLLSLAQRMEENKSGSYVFPLGLSPNQQIQSVVSYAMNMQGMKKFAILAPNDNFGGVYLNLFWDEVEKHGGKIVGIERYTPKSTDFREEVKKLIGLDYLEARKFETMDLKRRETEFSANLKVRGKTRQRLLQAFESKPLVDFDALFIPDDPATVGQIAPSFAVKEVDNLPLIGINTWNTPEIVQRAGRYLQKSIFVDGFFVGSKNPNTIKFVRDFQRQLGSVPGSIEVQAYDAAALLLSLKDESKFETRLKLRDQLIAKENFTGISGSFHFSNTGVIRDARLLSVKGTSIVELSLPKPAETTPTQVTTPKHLVD